MDAPPDVAGLRVVSGTGEELGVAIGIERDRFGEPKWIMFVEAPGAPPRKVKLRHVRSVGAEGIRLAGPREGYHITRVSPLKPDRTST